MLSALQHRENELDVCLPGGRQLKTQCTERAPSAITVGSLMPRHSELTFSSFHRATIWTALISSVLACSGQKAPDEVAQKPEVGMTAASGRSNGGAIASEAEDGQWVRPAKNYASTRFSGLTEINTDNVKGLHLAWTFGTGILRGHEAPPLVVNNTMYVVTPFPNILYALDLTKPGAPMKWIYRPGPIAAAQGVACCDVVNRGPSYADGKIVYNTLDNQTVAVDANTGK